MTRRDWLVLLLLAIAFVLLLLHAVGAATGVSPEIAHDGTLALLVLAAALLIIL